MMMMDPYWRSTRAFIVHRDENNGYGLTVSGDNPVAVQTIKRGGAADIAGIKEGDIIIKVNGALVDHLNHTEVVELIRSAGPYVTLTVRPADITNMPGMIGNSSSGGSSSARSSHLLQAPHERVTAPLPANHDVQVQMQCSKWRMLQAMRDEAASDADKLLEKYKVSQNHKDYMDYEKAKQRLEDIKMNMKAFRQSSPNLQLHSPVPFNVNPQIHHSVSFHPHFTPTGGAGSPVTPSSNVSTAMQRNRNPLSGHSVISGYPRLWEHNDQPPPLPPRSFSQSFSSSDNIFANPPSYSIHDPLGLGQLVLGQPVNVNSPNSQSSSGLSHKNYHASTNNAVANNKSPDSGLSSQQQQTHHRTKSSPDPVSMQKALSAAEASRRSDSVSDLSKNNNSRSRGSGAWDSVDSTSNRLSPPGSPPPPYGKHDPESGVFIEENNSFNNVNFSDFSPTKSSASALPNRPNQFSAVDIISMEEDDGLFSRDAGLNSSFGHYSSLSKLLEHNAHLAVFMNYVIDNKCDPSSLLFYLITGLYINEGNIKEMKRWAYEIHSTFTAPGSPLLVPHVDENIAKEIDDGLVNECDKEEMMRRVFRKARNKAKEEINKQLEEFSTKMTAGLGTMFGPPDSELEQSLNDKVKEQRIVYEYLLPRLEHLYDDWEKNLDDRTLAVVNAGATVVQKQFGVRSSSANSVIEKCSSFVSKEKSMRHKLLSKNKKVSFNGHHFTPQYYYSYTECNICCKLLWGVGPQGFACLNCNVNIHRNCLSSMQDNCVGSVHKKDKANDKLRKLKERIRPDRDPKRRSSSNWSMKKWPDDSLSINNSISSADIEIGDRPLSTGGTSSGNLRGSNPPDRRPDTLSEERTTNDGFVCEDEDVDRVQQEPRRSSTAVGRSESCKERVQRKQTRERRKHSDPNLTSRDVDLENQRHLSDANNSGSSSNSSLSGRSLESPSTSLELVGPSCHSSSSLPGTRNSETPETAGVIPDSVKPSAGWEGDSDIEIDQDPPDWTKNVPDAELRRLDRLEKKRQEVLNELFHTERSHVRNLKVVDRLFHRPIRQQSLVPSEIIHMLFANLEDMLEVHEQFNTALKAKRKESPLVSDIGPVLLEMFDGEKGNIFKQTAAYFCAKQQIGLELFKERRRKDPKFHAFLLEAESDPVCRRLQITDMIPMAMQRLTKYPLLFENLCNCTDHSSEEYKNIQRAVDLSKEILNSVNLAKKEAEDRQRLIEIQRRLDKSSLDKAFDKADPAIINELKNLDFTSHKLIYEGPLSWRMTKKQEGYNKQKSDFHDVQAILLDDLIVLLLRENDRFVLKLNAVHFAGKTDRVIARPIIRLHNLILREAAADKKAFFLLNTTSSNMNMYELWCPSTEDRKIWLHHITKAAEDYKSRQQESRREIHPSINIPPIVPEPDDRPSKENAGGEIGEPSADVSGEVDQQASGQESSSTVSKEPDTSNLNTSSSSTTETTTAAAAAASPESSTKNAPPGGKGKLSVTNGNNKQGRSYSVSPSPNRRKGEFLHVTVSSSPLVSPSEVVVATRNVQFAQPVVSQYEELKRVNASINKAFDEKLKLVSHLSNIPSLHPEEINQLGDVGPAKDAKDLVVACIQQVDQLGRILSGQVKVTNDNLTLHREQFAIQKSLSNLLTQLLSEVQRRDEDSESRRQELHRIREQNHGYQERLRSKDSQPSPGQLSSPSHSRPNSFLSVSSSSDHHDDEPEVVMKTHSKAQLCANYPVAPTSSSNRRSPQPFSSNSSSIPLPIDTIDGSGDLSASACDLGYEEFADAEEELISPDVRSLEKGESASTSIPMSPSCLSSGVGVGGGEETKEESHGNGTLQQSESKVTSNTTSPPAMNNQVPEDKIKKEDESQQIVCTEDENKSKTVKTNGHGPATVTDHGSSSSSSNSENNVTTSSTITAATTTTPAPSSTVGVGAANINCGSPAIEDVELDSRSVCKSGVLGEGDGVGMVVTKNSTEHE